MRLLPVSDDLSAWDTPIARLTRERDFYLRRCEALQRAQSHFRDPERTWVCNILANGMPTLFGDIKGTLPVKTERVFCCHCLRVTDCTVQRVIDSWIWTCTNCNKTVDVDWADEPEEY